MLLESLYVCVRMYQWGDVPHDELSLLAQRLTSLAPQLHPPSLIPAGNPNSTSFQMALLLRTPKLSGARWKRAREEALDSEILQKRFAAWRGRGENEGKEDVAWQV